MHVAYFPLIHYWHWSIIIAAATLTFRSSRASNVDCAEQWNKKNDASTKWADIKNVLSLIADKNTAITTADQKYTFSFCDNPSKGQKANVNGGVWSAEQKVLLGLSHGSDLIYQASQPGIAVQLKNGDLCTHKYDSVTVSSNRSTTVIFDCDLKADSPKLVYWPVGDDGCQSIFLLYSKHVCNVSDKTGGGGVTSVASTFLTSAPPKESSTAINLLPILTTGPSAVPSSSPKTTESHPKSHWPLFFFLLSIVALSYVLVGTMYKRCVEGARGAEQLPHYLTCVRIVNCIENAISSSSSHSRTSRPSSRFHNDFQYDQPPLTEDDSRPMMLDLEDSNYVDVNDSDASALNVRGGSSKTQRNVDTRRRPQPHDSAAASDTDDGLLVV